jgi:hypothetical protein
MSSTESLERLAFLIGRLRTRNREQSEQYDLLMEQSNNSEEQLKALKDSFDLSERELSLLKSVSESQGEYIGSLLTRIEEMGRISTRQSGLLKASLLKNKAFSIGVVVGLPVVFVLGVLIAK